MITVVVPTIRPESYRKFCALWWNLFEKHHCNLVRVLDGETPLVGQGEERFTATEVMGKDENLIFNLNDGVRNLGFAYVAKYLPETDIIITLDDDTAPLGDTIQDHINALNGRSPLGWLFTASVPTRGVPYGIRDKSEVVLSHGVWEGVADWDAPTQLVNGNKDIEFYKGHIPKGVFYPMCGMNIAFKKKMLPHMYFAPMGPRVGLDRFADIWCGIESKKIIDNNDWSVVTGYAKVKHERASNVWANLRKEAIGLEYNEKYGENDYFKLYSKMRAGWKKYIEKHAGNL